MAIHGKNGVFSLEDSGATTLRALTTDLTNVRFGRSNDVHDVTALGTAAHAFMAGLTNGTIALDGFFTTTASTGTATVLDSLLGLIGTSAGWEYGPDGSTTGKVKYSGEAILESLDYTQPVADVVTFAATLRITGSVTKGSYA